MGTDQRSGWELWLPLAVVAAWVGASAGFSVTVTAWGLAVLCAGAAVVRWVLSERPILVVRRRSLDVLVLGLFAVGFAFLALTGRLG